MREIKFRAWTTKYKAMEPPATLEQIYNFKLCDCGVNHFKELIIMQFTGLKDKNEKEIFEGDILKLSLDRVGKNYHLFQVVYSEPEARYKLKFVNSTDNLIEERFYDLNISKIHEFNGEVFGNIYENPELLEVQK